jgi:hypothetical protein
MNKQYLVILIIVMTHLISLGSVSAARVEINLVNQYPDPASAGDLVEIRLSVMNTGSESIQDVILELQETFPITIPSGKSNMKTISTLPTFQNNDNLQIIKFEVLIDKDATAGTYSIPIRYYLDGADTYIQEKIPLEVSTNKQLEIIEIDTTEIKPGEEKEITFTIKNVGKTKLSDVTFRWTNEEKAIIPIGGDNTQFISSIDIGEIKRIKYTVVANSNVDSGLYMLDLITSFKENWTVQSSQTQAGIYIGGGTEFDLSLSSTSNGEYSFSIANIGSNPAYSVSVKVPEQKGWKLSDKRADIIGNLNNGDYTVVSFELIPMQATELKLSVDYTNTRGIRETQEVIVPITASSTNRTASASSLGAITNEERAAMRTSKGGMGGMTQGVNTLKTYAINAGIAIVLIIVCIIIIMKVKNRKKKR